MQLYVADYLGDTRHLSTEQHGAYLLLLMAMWRAGGRLPNEAAKLARIVGLSPARWAKLEADVLAFFDADGADLTHGRVKKELKKFHETARKRSEAGAKGGAAKSLKSNDPDQANASGLPEQTAGNCPDILEPEPEPEEAEVADAPSEKKSASASSIPEGFPDADALAWARAEVAAHNCTLNLDLRAKRFRAHAEQSGRRERDWSAAWRGWVFNAIEDAPGAKPERPPPKAAVIALDPDEIERRWAQAVEV
jgi:uncharacterized protein YdaU (DUF1376 family)